MQGTRGPDPDWDEVANVIHRVARSIVPAHAADELCDGALAELAIRYVTVRGVRSWSALATVVARRACARWLDRRRRTPGTVSLSGVEIDHAMADEDSLESWFRTVFLPALLERLTPRQASALAACRDHRTVRAAARALRKKPSDVREILEEIAQKGRNLSRELPPPLHSEVGSAVPMSA